ncbi:MAG: UDP-N-acetylmuramoyl-tripeptide--D-alanyl-D-alanine ligase [Planctomycetota bacterium]|nr:UDP-N-acetylmuramoyl-tripeptide--D-alanyl-D-alanine ligase [Planctomycetota bacterium]
MSFLARDNLRALAGGRWLQRPVGDDDPVGVGTDTRDDLSGRVFVAIRGERFDGHDYLVNAAGKGAVMAIVDREPSPANLPEGLGVLLVNDARRALARIALAYRRTLSATKVIAITGSSGKTTTKRLVHAVLSSALPGSAAPRSFNNDIGVPLTILSARPHDRYLVVEIGTNAPGEIAPLAAIAEPDIAVITNVGRAHLAGFGSIDAILREKAALLSHLSRDGTAIISADVPGLADYARAVPTIIRIGESDVADLRLTARGRHDGPPRRNWFEINGRFRFDLSLPGKHNALNALAAVAIGRRFGLSDEQISSVLGGVDPEPMRMMKQRVGDIIVYNDAYNANPDSMAAALEAFGELAADAPRRIVVLGDMLELGEAGPALHRELGERLLDLDGRSGIDHAVFVGELVTHTTESLAASWPASRFTLLPELNDGAGGRVADLLRPGDAVLIKGSRILGLERLIDMLDRSGAAAGAPSATAEVEMKDAPRPGETAARRGTLTG